MEIDIAMPTKESADVIEQTLERAAAAIDRSAASVNRLVVVDDESGDGTRELARGAAEAHGWDATVVSESAPLPVARRRAIDLVETEWFWFLDDDVRVRADYVERLLDAVAPAVGAVQGRKASRTEHPSDWLHQRSRRGGTHATLVRREAVADVEIPEDVAVLEDEYLRRWIESSGYAWFFHPHARFVHDCQDRHEIGWTEGYVGGKYGLQSLRTVAMNVPYAAATGRDPTPHLKRAAGWVAGSIVGDGDPPRPPGATVEVTERTPEESGGTAEGSDETAEPSGRTPEVAE
ncbi:glycosyltransferase family 2 protein [Halomicrobium salinisoli]|uniref:glycosyltransferase family 2 protein n=1 Tax=Halomicrobium salinisoli TaxID=2878391 RepID=UPI001CF0D298|nr:glycosyltransferase [Halomicrobium salinisoli]